MENSKLDLKDFKKLIELNVLSKYKLAINIIESSDSRYFILNSRIFNFKFFPDYTSSFKLYEQLLMLEDLIDFYIIKSYKKIQ